MTVGRIDLHHVPKNGASTDPDQFLFCGRSTPDTNLDHLISDRNRALHTGALPTAEDDNGKGIDSLWITNGLQEKPPPSDVG
jgi:hypothetical protein